MRPLDLHNIGRLEGRLQKQNLKKNFKFETLIDRTIDYKLKFKNLKFKFINKLNNLSLKFLF